MARNASKSATATLDTPAKSRGSSRGPARQSPTRPSAKSKANAQPNYEQIAERAYQIWVEQGQPSGVDQQTWYQAEQDLQRSQ